jgi:exopolyphosphatase / guanosine-5'-triphosphate,3'-diphosphate pyrophosphatase
MPRYAVIDIGTNSVKFNISERGDDGAWRTIVDRAEITRLGEGLEKTGEISPDAMERTVSAIAAMVEEAQRARIM